MLYCRSSTAPRMNLACFLLSPHDAQAQKVKEVPAVEHLRHVLPFVARYRKRLLLGLLCAAGSAALTALIPDPAYRG